MCATRFGMSVWRSRFRGRFYRIVLSLKQTNVALHECVSPKRLVTDR